MTYRDDFWVKSEPIGVPISMRGRKPILWTMGEYSAKGNGGVIHVARQYGNGREWTRFTYRGVVEENVRVEAGNISEVRSCIVEDPGLDRARDEQEAQEAIQRLFNPPKTERPQYINIKLFAEDFQFLIEREPSWKPDIEAIVIGSGYF